MTTQAEEDRINGALSDLLTALELADHRLAACEAPEATRAVQRFSRETRDLLLRSVDNSPRGQLLALVCLPLPEPVPALELAVIIRETIGAVRWIEEQSRTAEEGVALAKLYRADAAMRDKTHDGPKRALSLLNAARETLLGRTLGQDATDATSEVCSVE